MMKIQACRANANINVNAADSSRVIHPPDMLQARSGDHGGGMMEETRIRRCDWAERDVLLRGYHDREWGVPERDGRALWEKLMLDGFQAGLSWLTILRKRDAFREAFAGFDPAAVARFTEADIDRLMENAGIIRARAKIAATIGNAQAYLAMQAAGEDFSTFCWGMVGDEPLRLTGPAPTRTAVSEAMSKALNNRGFKFVGPVIVYAWMQATGMADDHTPECFRHHAYVPLKPPGI